MSALYEGRDALGKALLDSRLSDGFLAGAPGINFALRCLSFSDWWGKAALPSESLPKESCLPIQDIANAIVGKNGNLHYSKAKYGIGFDLLNGESGNALAFYLSDPKLLTISEWKDILDRLQGVADLQDLAASRIDHRQFDLHPLTGVCGILGVILEIGAIYPSLVNEKIIYNVALSILALGEKNYHLPVRGFFSPLVRDQMMQGSAWWCFGDILIGMILKSVFLRYGDHTASARCSWIIRTASNQPFLFYNSRSIGVDNGLGGLVHLMQILFSTTGDSFYRSMAQFWIERLLAALGWNPYSGLMPSSMRQLESGRARPGVGVGIAGALLALNDALGGTCLRWDSAFGMTGIADNFNS